MTYKPKATGWPQLITEDGIFSNTATQKYPLGMMVLDIHGNTYRYVKANEAIAVGQVVTPIAKTTFDSAQLYGAGASGDDHIHIDTKAAAVTINQYTDYFIGQASAAGLGAFYRLAGHPAADATAVWKANLATENTLIEAFADNVALNVYNPYLIELTDAATEFILGVAIGTLTSGYYGFIQTGGFCPCVAVGHSTSVAIVVNEPMAPVAANPGSCEGVEGGDEVDIFCAFCSPLIALQAVAANTTGYVPAFMKLR